MSCANPPSYVAGQIPSNMILPYVRPSIYLPCCALVWSGVSAATAGVTNYQGLLACRVMLGVCEAPLLPGVSDDSKTELATTQS
jgi:MFS transporter, ACS family, DAL5 transporter family protein